jgi:ArsR family transcriptional regulator, virulence genes transcriptional regulator
MKEKILERILKSLANRRRLLILGFLKKNRSASVGDIATNIKLSFKATSKHLGVLGAADIVEKEQTGPNIFYSIQKIQTSFVKKVLEDL